MKARNLRSLVFGATVVMAGMLALAPAAEAQKVDGIKGLEATKPINLQLTPTDAFVRIRGWSLPAPILPLAVMGSWGGRGTVSGAGAVHVPVGQISQPVPFEFPRDINGETETMIVSLSARSDWTGSVNPMSRVVEMNMPMTLRIQAHHVRMVDIPWPGGWIYGNIDCTVPLDFGPMTTSHMEPPVADLEVPPVTDGKPYDPASGKFTVINNSMTIGGFHCSHPDIGAGKVEDELNGAVAIPSGPGATDARFNLAFLAGGDVIRPQPAIRPAFESAPAGVGVARLDARASHAAAGVLRYVWDFDADGEPDLGTGKPIVTHDFGSAGEHPVGMLVVDRDGDFSGWARAKVKAGERKAGQQPGMGRLKISAKKTKRARPGARVKLRVKVRNLGQKAIPKLRLCVRAKRRLARTGGCRAEGKLAAGATRKLVVKVKLKRRAKAGTKVAVRLKATGEGARSATARIKIPVRR